MKPDCKSTEMSLLKMHTVTFRVGEFCYCYPNPKTYFGILYVSEGIAIMTDIDRASPL